MVQSCYPAMIFRVCPSIIYISKVFSTISVAANVVSVDADRLKELRDFGQFQALLISDSQNDLLEQIVASRLKSIRNAANGWLRVKRLVVSLTNSIASLR